MNNLFKAESAVSLLLAIVLFSILFLSYAEWQNQQHRQQQFLFQQQQALQIAENQIALQMAGKPCQRRIEQNQTTFELLRCTPSEIQIRFPLGELHIGKKGASPKPTG